jgi:cell division protein FtsI (penicillin-binding protein 3)
MDDVAATQAWRTTIRHRVVATSVLFVLWVLGIEARLVYLQVYRHDDLTAQAIVQRSRTVDVPARRGGIVDRAGHMLAMSVNAESIYAVPTLIDKPEFTIATLCGALDGCGPKERDALIQRVRQNRKKQFLYLKRLITPDETRRVLALELEGINLVTESRRVYPNRELAAHVLGYVGVDNRGLGGIEASYDSKIRGREGTMLVESDALRHAYGRVERPPTSGATVELTIDVQLQHIAERELHAAVEERHAAGGTVVIMEPHTGEILALANEPTFNPNTFRDVDADVRRNRGVQEIYEPGSTFKLVTASAAIEEKVFTLTEPIDVSGGQIQLASRVVRDVHAYAGSLSFTDVIVKSSNVGAIKIGTRLGSERLGRYVRRFGFGTRICPDLPGESAGMLSDPATWSPSTLASVSMGYEIGVTPIQMAAAVSAVANGGTLFQPHAVRAWHTGARRIPVELFAMRRAADPETIAEMTSIMEQVVERGTGKQAQVPGFTVAGKTGTASKIVNGRYQKSDYHASFVGFVPSRHPAVTVLVVIDSPRGGAYTGGAVAAPVFERVAEQALRYLGIAPTINPAPPVLVADMLPAAPASTITPTAVVNGRGSIDVATGAPVVPDLRGLSAREAVRRLAVLGLAAHVTGAGTVTDQDPLPGAPLDEHSTCRLRLGRLPVPVSGSLP